jgi:hypothetical protein
LKLLSPYLYYGLVVLGLSGGAQWLGYSPSRVTEVKNVPKSVRENPGVYRSHYGWLPRWFGGK